MVLSDAPLPKGCRGMICTAHKEVHMHGTLMFWGSVVSIIALLLVMMLRAPSTFLFDLIDRIFSHDGPYRRP